MIGCVNCTIFIGPVDGPAIFKDCSNCQVAVASQQFQAKGCHDCSFGMYSATGPTLSQCTRICISPWCGSYSHLDAHFQSANLDPNKNQFSNVYDASQDDGAVPNFTVLLEAGAPWIVSDKGEYTTESSSVHKMEGYDTNDDSCPSEGWIKAVKPTQECFSRKKPEWQKTLDLIDLEKNSNLSRFKSVLLSICNDEN